LAIPKRRPGRSPKVRSQPAEGLRSGGPERSWYHRLTQVIRCSRCSPTRIALAMMVRPRFTAPMLDMKCHHAGDGRAGRVQD
jgi:hypothetical protein